MSDNHSLKQQIYYDHNNNDDDNNNNNSSHIKNDENNVAETVLITIGIILGILLILFLIRQYIQGPRYRKKNRIDGKVVIVTGCNTGIGKETVLDLAKRGAKIYMACRDSGKCETARLEIIKKSQNQNIFNRTLDLSSLESIKKFADQFREEETKLDILINNAGVMACPKNSTKDGYELQFGVNHLGHFYLTNLLLDLLKLSAPSRIVIVTSALYFIGNIKKDDINSEKSYTRFSAYAQSKMANVIFTKHLSRILKDTGVTVNCCHPGVVKTELSRHIIPGLAKIILTPFTSYLMKTPKAGAQTTLRLALDPCLENVTGHYYFDTYMRFPILPKAKNPELAEWLWKKSEDMIREKQQKNDIQLSNNNQSLTTITATTTTTTPTTTTTTTIPTVIEISNGIDKEKPQENLNEISLEKPE